MRVILFTGKGGVGKTSVAAASAMACAKEGLKTVIMSTDPAHSLGDSFETKLGDELVEVRENLWAHEVSSLHEIQRHWKTLHDYASEMLASQGLDEIVAEEMANPPGMDEAASLMYIKHYMRKGEHDVLIVDCAPTGETLQLLSFPEAAGWWLDKMYPWQRRAMKIARPVLQPMMSMPLPSDQIFASLKDLLLDLEGMRKILTDPKVTSVRIVLNLEKMVIEEAKRAYTYLSLFNYVTDAVIVNRRLVGEQEGLFKKWQEIHKRYEAGVEEAFSGVPIFNVPLFEQEVVGEKMLLKMAKAVYGERSPSEHFVAGKAQRIEQEGDDYVLVLKVPFIDKTEVDLSRHNNSLFVSVANYRREVSLPKALAQRETGGANIKDGELRVRFVGEKKIGKRYRRVKAGVS